MQSVRFVVVSGLPGSGKSTLGSRIAPLLGLELRDKDDFLERSFAGRDVDRTERQRLSRQADHLMRKKVELTSGAVLVSHWQRPEISTTSGTPTGWLTELPNLVEAHCQCSPTTAARRFLERDRHAAHGDAAKDPAAIVEQFHALAALGPLDIGPVVEVDTEADLDIVSVVKAITRA